MNQEEIEKALTCLTCLAAEVRRDLDQKSTERVIHSLIHHFMRQEPGNVLMHCVYALVEVARRLDRAEVEAHPSECRHDPPGGESEDEDDDEDNEDHDHGAPIVNQDVLIIPSKNQTAVEIAEWEIRLVDWMTQLFDVLSELRKANDGKTDGETAIWIQRQMVTTFVEHGNLSQQLLTHATTAMVALRKIPQHVIELYLVGDPEGVLPKL